MEPGSAHCCTKGLEQVVQWLRTKAVVPKRLGFESWFNMGKWLNLSKPQLPKFEEDGDHTPSYEIVMRCNEINGYI